MTIMQIQSRFSTATDTAAVLNDLTEKISVRFDLGIIFLSNTSKQNVEQLVQEIQKRTGISCLIGCTSIGVIGGQTEIEEQPAASLLLLKLPHVKIIPLRFEQNQLKNMDTPEHIMELLDVYPNEKPNFIVFSDPFSFDISSFLNMINTYYPGSSVIGGLASGSTEEKGNLLILNEQIFEEGMVAVSLTGNILVETIVSQGCRPIGQNYIITKSEGNVIYELGGKSLFEVLQETLSQIPSRDKMLAQEAICIGIAMDEYKHKMQRGDFLIRLLIGIDQQSGAGAVSELIETGQTIQFHIRDALSATEDLTKHMQEWNTQARYSPPQGALVVTCAGRGERLFHERNHDISIAQKFLGGIPVSGFFSSGEFGQVANKNFAHGFTCAIALFYPADVPLAAN